MDYRLAAHQITTSVAGRMPSLFLERSHRLWHFVCGVSTTSCVLRSQICGHRQVVGAKRFEAAQAGFADALVFQDIRHRRGHGCGLSCVQKQGAPSSGQNVFRRVCVLTSNSVPHHGLGQAQAQFAFAPRAPGHLKRLGAMDVYPRRLVQGRGVDRRVGCADQGVVFAQSAGSRGQQPTGETPLQHVLRHGAVGGPFATGDGDQPVAVDHDGVFTRQHLGATFCRGRWRHQRAQTDPDAADVFRAHRAAQHPARLAQNEIQLLGKGLRLARQVLAWRVGRAEDQFAQPGHGEEHPAVAGLGHQQCVVTGHEFAVHHDVHTLAGADHALGHRVLAHPAGLGAQIVHPMYSALI
eukprot:Opistho-1_new@7734